MNESDIQQEAAPRWSIRRTVGYSLLIGLLFVAVQTAIVVVMIVVRTAADPGFDVEQWADGAESDGLALALATIASAVFCIPFVRFLAGRHESDPWDFLRLRRTGVKSVLTWVLWLVAFIVASDSLTKALDRPIIPDFMINVYTSVNPVLLFVALVIAAPLFEEIFFRGFIPGALESSGVSVVAAAVVSSLAWAAIHLQYGMYEISTIFLMGLLFAAARVKAGSLIPCLVMHGLGNAIAFAETVYVVESGGL